MAQERFELGAATWDENPGRVQNAQAVAAAILHLAELPPDATMVDYGCGTGLVTLALAPHAGRVVAIDSSPAMLGVLRDKAAALGLATVETREVDLEHSDAPALDADLVVCSMVLHHVADVPPVIARLAAMLRAGGRLAIADLDSEDGSFHQDRTGVYHSGFDREWLAGVLRAAGLTDVRFDTANVIERPGERGTDRYGVFVAVATRE